MPACWSVTRQTPLMPRHLGRHRGRRQGASRPRTLRPTPREPLQLVYSAALVGDVSLPPLFVALLPFASLTLRFPVPRNPPICGPAGTR